MHTFRYVRRWHWLALPPLVVAIAVVPLQVAPASAAENNYCAAPSGADPGSDPAAAFGDDTDAFYTRMFDWWSQHTNTSFDVTCAVGSHLVESGAESVVLGPYEEAVRGESKLGKAANWVYDKVFENAVSTYLGDQATARDNPLEVPVGPEEGSTPPVQQYVVADSVLSGTFGRADAIDGTWYSQASPPANARVWYPNSTTVGILCSIPGAVYTVQYLDGHSEQWSTWYRTVDLTYVPAAAFQEVTTDGQSGVPLC